MRSGSDLGVVRLPLKYGEKVLEVAGSTGWRVDGADLVLPTAGHAAHVTVTGTLPAAPGGKIGRFENDPRSAYEWWLFESDAEHRLTVTGDARQVDVTESPIPRQQATSRLFMVQRGQSMELSVQSLFATEVLAAVVRQHQRVAVLTGRGDLVTDDRFTYENNGIDYLPYTPHGRAIFLATNNVAERIMRTDKAAEELLIPLRSGTHSVRVQALADAPLHRLGGWLTLDGASYPLTTSTSTMTIGVPRGVIPVAVVGGDRPEWFVGWGDAVAVVAGIVLASIAFRGTRRRVLGAIVLAGAWFLSKPFYALLVGALVIAGIILLLRRLLSGRALVIGGVIAAAGVAFLMIATAIGVAIRSSSRGSAFYEEPLPPPAAPTGASNQEGGMGTRAKEETSARDDADSLGNRRYQNAKAGVIEGVTPVALPLPSYARSVTVHRELVTQDRPFRPTLYYVTQWALLPFGVVWLVCAALLVRAYRPELARLWQWLHARFAPQHSRTAPDAPKT